MLSSNLWVLSSQKHHQEQTTVTMRTKFTSTTISGTSVTHYTHEGAGGPTSTTYQGHEKHLFAFPALLVGENLLKTAETRSNQKISDEVSAARVTADGPLLTGAEVASRITSALESRTGETGITLQDAQHTFAAIRKTNGVLFIKFGLKRTGKNESSATAVEDSAMADTSDSELSELETDDEQ
jgi:hypothetical protein